MTTNTVAPTEVAIAETPGRSATAVAIEGEPAPIVTDSGLGDSAQPAEHEPTHQKLLSLGVLWPAEVDRICDEGTRTQFLVDGFLPAMSIGIAAGDSTIGKSPLMYQLGICVAAGLPFLGRKTKQGRVLYFDLENAMDDSQAMRDALVRFLGLSATPEDFLLATEQRDLAGLEGLIAEVKPSLVIMDSLRAFAPEATSKNREAAEWLRSLKRVARKYGVCFLIIHHLRKPSKDFGRGQLSDEVRASDWMLEMEGPRAFVNQTDVRIALDEGDRNPAALRMKWSRRVYGDSPLVLLERVFDEDGEPAGYRHLTGAALLNPERRTAFEKLPAEFRFKDARAALNRSDAPTNNFLNECKQLGLIEKVGGHYRKLTPQGEGIAPESPRVDRVTAQAPCGQQDGTLSPSEVRVE